MAALGKAIKDMTGMLKPKPAKADSTSAAKVNGALSGPTPSRPMTFGNAKARDIYMRAAEQELNEQSKKAAKGSK